MFTPLSERYRRRRGIGSIAFLFLKRPLRRGRSLADASKDRPTIIASSTS